MLWSFAKQAQLSLEVIESLGDDVKLVSTGRLAVYETSCLDNGEDVIKRLFVRAAEAGIDMGLSRFTNQDLSNTVSITKGITNILLCHMMIFIFHFLLMHIIFH